MEPDLFERYGAVMSRQAVYLRKHRFVELPSFIEGVEFFHTNRQKFWIRQADEHFGDGRPGGLLLGWAARRWLGARAGQFVFVPSSILALPVLELRDDLVFSPQRDLPQLRTTLLTLASATRALAASSQEITDQLRGAPDEFLRGDAAKPALVGVVEAFELLDSTASSVRSVLAQIEVNRFETRFELTDVASAAAGLRAAVSFLDTVERHLP